MYIGDFNAGDIIDFKFTTVDNTGAPTALSSTPALSVYKGNNTTETTTGITVTASFDTRTGLNHVRIDTSQDATFYANGNDFQVVITTGTVGGTSVVGYVVGHFSLRNRSVTLRAITHTGAVVPTVSTLTGHTPQTGDTFARVGAPVGASLSADIASNKTVADAIKVKTDNLPGAIKKNTALSNFQFIMTDNTNHVAKTGISNASFTKKVRIDNAAQVNLSGTITEVDSVNFPGLYSIDLTAAELNGNVITLRFAASGADDTVITLVTNI